MPTRSPRHCVVVCCRYLDTRLHPEKLFNSHYMLLLGSVVRDLRLRWFCVFVVVVDCILHSSLYAQLHFLFIIHIFRRSFFGRGTREFIIINGFSPTQSRPTIIPKWWCWAWMDFVGFVSLQHCVLVPSSASSIVGRSWCLYKYWIHEFNMCWFM